MSDVADKGLLSADKKLARILLPVGRSVRVVDRLSVFQPAARRGLLLLYAVLVALVACTWYSTADVLIDFGRELYVPWQLVQGKTLYQDVAYFNGPLSPHFNALVFRIFGDTMLTLLVTNTLILVMLVTLLYALLLRYFSVVASTVACICMLVVFGIAHPTSHGNYNYITPYSHELTHGLLLALVMLTLLRFDEKFKLWKWSLIGVLWGLVFLGKAEVFVATTAMLCGSLLMPLLGAKMSIRQALVRAGSAAGCAALPIAAFWLLLSRQTGSVEASWNLLGSWRYILTSDVTGLYFYRALAGMTHPAGNLLAVVFACTGIGAVLFGLCALERNIGGRGWGNLVAAAALVFAFLVSGCSAFVLQGRAFIVIALALLFWLGYRAIRHREDFQKYHHLVCWAIFAMGLMSKIALRSELVYYGFALMMPVVVLAIAVAVDWLPKIVSRDGAGQKFRLALIALLLFDSTVFLAKTIVHTQEKKCVIGQGPDCLRCTEKQGVPLKAAASYLAERMKPEDTLLVLPEGISLNYLLRRENGSPHVNFMQPELVTHGEENVLADFRRNPSDYVLLVSRRVEMYGLHHFGQAGYGDRIMKWIRANYTVEKQFGADPFVPGEFGVQVLRRRRS